LFELLRTESAKKILGTLLGAFLAGLFGVGSTFYTEHVKSIKDENAACRIVALQLDSEITGIRSLNNINNRDNKRGINITHIGDSSDFLKYRATISDLLTQNEMEGINNMFSDVSRVDHIMDVIVRMSVGTSNYEQNPYFIIYSNGYWDTVENMNKDIDKYELIAIKNKLVNLSNRSSYFTW